MKLKLQQRILSAEEQPATWIVSFMGSSVTSTVDPCLSYFKQTR